MFHLYSRVARRYLHSSRSHGKPKLQPQICAVFFSRVRFLSIFCSLFCKDPGFVVRTSWKAAPATRTWIDLRCPLKCVINPLCYTVPCFFVTAAGVDCIFPFLTQSSHFQRLSLSIFAALTSTVRFRPTFHEEDPFPIFDFHSCCFFILLPTLHLYTESELKRFPFSVQLLSPSFIVCPYCRRCSFFRTLPRSPRLDSKKKKLIRF
jgi:hypothetical protein